MQWKIGDVTITQVRESQSPIPPMGLFPDAGVDIGARIGFGLLTWPSDWLIVGGHRQFASILLCNGHPALGLDIGVTTAANDNKVRLGASVWNEGGSHYGWTMYLAGGVVKF